jgi:hypothetical protein
MNTAELKLELFRNIDKLKEQQLSELNGVIINMLHGRYGNDDWDALTKHEQEGIIAAIEDLNTNGGIPHETVMQMQRAKINNA